MAGTDNIAAIVATIAEAFPGHENDALAAIVIHSLGCFLAAQPGADSLAAALNQRLAALPGNHVWQLAQIPRAALDDIQRAIAEGMRGQTQH